MNEWRRLLDQTQYKKPQASTLSVDFASQGAKEDSSAAATENTESPAAVDLEWISPTAKLQEKIENIPDKFGFKIGEAADYLGVKQYVLRYWESEFDRLKPKKSKNGQRMYTKKDVETALLIQKLLHDDRFSIEGARSALTQLKKQVRETVKAQKEAKKGADQAAPRASEASIPARSESSSNANPRSLTEAVASAERLLETIRRTREGLQLY